MNPGRKPLHEPMDYQSFPFNRAALIVFLIVITVACGKTPEEEARRFIDVYAAEYQKLDHEAALASWQANTHISPLAVRKEGAAQKKKTAFLGAHWIIAAVKKHLASGAQLTPQTLKQLEIIRYKASRNPATLPHIVSRLANAEANQSALLARRASLTDVAPEKEKNVRIRLRQWETALEAGKLLKNRLAESRDLRNLLAREMGYSSFFGMEASDDGMTSAEALQLMTQAAEEIKPLYIHIHTWMRYKLAEGYGLPVPDTLPAHWPSNLWSQDWTGIMERENQDGLFAEMEPESLVHQAGAFFISLGFEPLPDSFWKNSDLFPVAPGESRLKSPYASSWHIDLRQDVRALMNVESNSRWFRSLHHELAHIYYFLSYAKPEIPVLLREGASRFFHEAFAALIDNAAMQPSCLRDSGLRRDNTDPGAMNRLLYEALDNIVFIPWATVMTRFEYDLYEQNLPKETFNSRWWFYVEKYQGVAPPYPRGEMGCDPAAKIHIHEDPAQYYDYALAKLLRYQLHGYICAHILNSPLHNTSYYRSRATGDFLRRFLRKGKTINWRITLREATGEDLSARPMMEYFKPLLAFLEKENRGRKLSHF